jgi:hypothetical protein
METKRARTAAFVGTVILMGAVAAGADGAGNPAGVVAALAGKPPHVLSELEAIVGPLHRDPAKWGDAVGPLYRVFHEPAFARATVELAIDPFHQDPQKVADPSLRHWDLDFLSGRVASRRLLAARFRDLREIRVDNRIISRFGDLYLTDLDTADGFRLSWYDREPLFAVPLRNASETAKLVEALAAVAHAGFTRQAVVARLGALKPDPGHGADVLRTETWDLIYEPLGAAKPQRLTINFKRPLPARELLPKLGILKPAVRSNDTHLQSRDIFDQAISIRDSYKTGYPLPAVGGYAVEIHVDPEGLIEMKERTPGSPVWSADGARIISFTALAPWLDPKQKRL